MEGDLEDRKGKKVAIVNSQEEAPLVVERHGVVGDEYASRVDEYLDSFPPGYRFHPSDTQLIVEYLMKKVANETLPINRIRDVNIYLYNPQQLSDMYTLHRETVWYFFTPRDRKYPNGNRPNRSAGDGYWKATGADAKIESNNKKVGLRKSLVFYEGKPGRGVKTNWIMHEYRIYEKNAPRATGAPNDMKLDAWVLCKIYNRIKGKRDKEEQNSEEGTLTNPDEGDLVDDGSSLMSKTELSDMYGDCSGASTSTKSNNRLDDYLFNKPLQRGNTHQNLVRNSNMGLAPMNHAALVESNSPNFTFHACAAEQISTGLVPMYNRHLQHENTHQNPATDNIGWWAAMNHAALVESNYPELAWNVCPTEQINTRLVPVNNVAFDEPPTSSQLPAVSVMEDNHQLEVPNDDFWSLKQENDDDLFYSLQHLEPLDYSLLDEIKPDNNIGPRSAAN